MTQKRNVKIVSISLKKEELEKIDNDRGEVPRSAYIITKINENGKKHDISLINSELRTITEELNKYKNNFNFLKSLFENEKVVLQNLTDEERGRLNEI